MARTPRSTKALPVRNGEAQLCNLLWEVWAVLYLPGEDGVLGTRVVPSPPRRRCGRINVAGGLLSQGADPARALNTELFFFFKSLCFLACNGHNTICQIHSDAYMHPSVWNSSVNHKYASVWLLFVVQTSAFTELFFLRWTRGGFRYCLFC